MVDGQGRVLYLRLGSSFARDQAAILPNRHDSYQVEFVFVYVRDQERSMRFFVEQLGFRLLFDVRFASGNRWIEVAPPDGTASLALVLPAQESDEERLVGHSGAVSFLSEDVEAKYHEWSKRGVRFTLALQRPAFRRSVLPIRGSRWEYLCACRI